MRDYSRIIFFMTDKSMQAGGCHIHVIKSGCNTFLLQQDMNMS